MAILLLQDLLRLYQILWKLEPSRLLTKHLQALQEVRLPTIAPDGLASNDWGSFITRMNKVIPGSYEDGATISLEDLKSIQAIATRLGPHVSQAHLHLVPSRGDVPSTSQECL